MSPIAICAGIGTGSLLLQIWPRLRNRYFGIDTWRHLMIADQVRQHGRLPGRLPEKYLIDMPLDYPPVLRLLLAIFPKRVIEEGQWLISPLFDLLHSVLLFTVTYTVTEQLACAALAQILYALSPLVAMEASSLTTRSLASLLCSCAMVALLAYPIWTHPALYGIALFFLTLLVLTHRMAIQAMTMLFIVWSVVDRSWYYVGSLLIATAIATLVSGGYYLKVLRGHLSMFIYWRNHMRDRFSHQIRGAPSQQRKSPDVVFRLYELTEQIPFLPVMMANPWTLLAAAMPLIQIWRGPLDLFQMPADYFVKLWQWATMLLGIGLAVRVVPALRFIGEGERYLEYAAFPSGVIVAVMVINGGQGAMAPWAIAGAVLLAVVGCLGPLLYVQRRVVLYDRDRSVTPELRQIFEVINRLPGEVRLGSVPLYLVSAAEYFTKARVLSTDSGWAHITHLSEFFPVLRRPLTEIIAKYDLTHLLISERYVSLAELKMAEAPVVCRIGAFCLLDVSSRPVVTAERPVPATTVPEWR